MFFEYDNEEREKNAFFWTVGMEEKVKWNRNRNKFVEDEILKFYS